MVFLFLNWCYKNHYLWEALGSSVFDCCIPILINNNQSEAVITVFFCTGCCRWHSGMHYSIFDEKIKLRCYVMWLILILYLVKIVGTWLKWDHHGKGIKAFCCKWVKCVEGSPWRSCVLTYGHSDFSCTQ